ncbi:hypothetical protein KCU78_g1835, partial [Aureobasidium melanogenum]
MPCPNSFQAAVVPEQGARHIVATRTLAPLEPGEVAIKITATAVNPIDWKMRDWNYWLKEYPAVLGSDAAGEVVAVADDVKTLEEGDRVFFQGIIANYHSSTFQQYCKMPSRLVANTPSNIRDDQAAGISLATVCGLTAFYDQTGLNLRPLPWEQDGNTAGEGKAVVIVGGSSSVGQYAVQLARLSGFSKIVTNSSPNHQAHLLGLGATTVLDRSTESSPAHFSAALGETPLSFVFDTISIAETHMLAAKIVQSALNVENALIVRVNLDDLNNAVQQQSQTGRLVNFKPIIGASSFPNLRPLIETAWERFGGDDGFIARGLFRPNPVTVVYDGLSSVDEALELNKQGVSGTKIVIKPFETQNE